MRLCERASRSIFVLAVAGIMLLFSECRDGGVVERFMRKPDRIVVERRPDPTYDRLFPILLDICATSQFRSKLKGEVGLRLTRSCISRALAGMRRCPTLSCGDAGPSQPSSMILNTVLA